MQTKKETRGGIRTTAQITHKQTHTMKAKKVLKTILWAVIILAILNYCQELNDCLMRY